MTNLVAKEKSIVIPGEALAQSMDYLPGRNTYREGDTIYAKRLCLFTLQGRATTITPLTGKYLPKYGDKIIVRVTDIALSGWIVDTNCAYRAMLGMKDATSKFIKRGEDLTKYFAIGDYLLVQVINVTSQNVVDISMKEPGLRKLSGGRIIKVNPTKVPRIIGKQGSMVTLIKTKTGCDISIGQNGVVWLRGADPDNEVLAVKAIKKVEKEAHIPGLTARMEEFLKSAKPVEAPPRPQSAPQPRFVNPRGVQR